MERSTFTCELNLPAFISEPCILQNHWRGRGEVSFRFGAHVLLMRLHHALKRSNGQAVDAAFWEDAIGKKLGSHMKARDRRAMITGLRGAGRKSVPGPRARKEEIGRAHV